MTLTRSFIPTVFEPPKEKNNNAKAKVHKLNEIKIIVTNNFPYYMYENITGLMWLRLNEKWWKMINGLGWSIIAWFRSICIGGRFFTMEYEIVSLWYPWCWPTSTYRYNVSQTKMNNHVRVKVMLCLCCTYIICIMLVVCLKIIKDLSVWEFDNHIIYRIFWLNSLSIWCYFVTFL